MSNPPILCHWPDGTQEVLNVAVPRTGFCDGCTVGIWRAARVCTFDEPRRIGGVEVEGEIWLAPLDHSVGAPASELSTPPTPTPPL